MSKSNNFFWPPADLSFFFLMVSHKIITSISSEKKKMKSNLKSLATALSSKFDPVAIIGDDTGSSHEPLHSSAYWKKHLSCWSQQDLLLNDSDHGDNDNMLSFPSFQLLHSNTVSMEENDQQDVVKSTSFPPLFTTSSESDSNSPVSENETLENLPNLPSLSATTEQEAIDNLNDPITFCLSGNRSASKEMACNILESFSTLIQANLRQYFKRQNPSCHQCHRLASSYMTQSMRSPVSFGSIILSFIPVDSNEPIQSSEETNSSTSMKIDFKLDLEVVIYGKTFLVSLQVPGQIEEVELSRSLYYYTVGINNRMFLFDFRNKARMVAWKALQPLMRTTSEGKRQPTFIPPEEEHADEFGTRKRRKTNNI